MQVYANAQGVRVSGLGFRGLGSRLHGCSYPLSPNPRFLGNVMIRYGDIHYGCIYSLLGLGSGPVIITLTPKPNTIRTGLGHMSSHNQTCGSTGNSCLLGFTSTGYFIKVEPLNSILTSG